ncbi:glycine betaine ABC transporter substrate-binding protein [Nguyenibacter vanlangensis]|uniref:Glycine betaine ABC transporter substrate-binding protein n=1 Tax=Nguyenibacter vanlangensis TaxID=1216886 RepID=A0ABZ3D661_9PROT
MTTVTLGHPDSILHAAEAASVVRVLEAHELEVAYVTGGKAELAAAMTAGRIDLFVSAWLPDIDAAWASGLPGMEAFGQLYKPVFGWSLPEGAAPQVAGIGDLAHDETVSRNIVAAESVLEHVRQAVAAYGLAARGFTIEARPDDEAYDHAGRAIASGEAAILPLWQPNFLHHGSRLRTLGDPKGALGSEQHARMLLRRAAREDVLDSDLLDELDELTLGNKVVNALDYAMRREGMSADEAAEAWQRGKLLPR